MKWAVTKSLSLFLVCLGAAATSAFAETNESEISTNFYAMSPTNAPGISYPGPVRQLSLQDCIRLALQHNLELQIERYNPQIQLYNLRGYYGAYDPTLDLKGQHDHNESGTQLFNGVAFPGTISDDNSFSGSLGASTPWGMNYSLSTQGPIRDTYGNRFTSISNSVPFENTSGQVLLSATQPLLKNFWIDQTRLNIKVAKNRLNYSELQLRLQVMQTVTTLEQAYYDLIYSRENVLVQQKAAEQTDRLVMESRKKLEVGALSPLDLASAEAQAAQNRAAIIAANSQLGTQERKVKQLIADQFSEWARVGLEPTGTLEAPRKFFNRQESWTRALATRPELLQAKLDAEKAGIQLKYDWNQLFPELNVFGSFGYNGAGTEFSGALYDLQQHDREVYSFGGELKIPLANVSARNTYKSDKLALQQVVLSVKKTERDIMIAIDNDIGTLQADYDSVQATRAQREYEEQALDAEQKKLANGKSTTYQVLLIQRDLTTAAGAEIKALDTYNKDLSQLSLDEGTTLDRLKIDINLK